MKINHQRSASWLSVLLLASALAGCSGGSGAPKEQSKGADVNLNEPVTLTFVSQFADTKDYFDKLYGDRIRKKFPNVTINFIQRGTGTGINDLIASGTYPDIMYGNLSDIDGFLIDQGLAYDMSDLVKKFNFNLSALEPVHIDSIKNSNPDGALIGLPMPSSQVQVLFYNKALFDKFGVPYPKDGMTWDETYDLARKMTRVDGGQVYRGFSSFIGALLRDNQLSVPYLDPKADQMAAQEKWAGLINNLGRFYAIENNNRDPKKRSQTEEYTAFQKNMNVAMQVNQLTRYLEFPSELNWDMVTIPTFKEAPNTGSQPGAYYWYITKTNKSKDISFAIIAYLLSEEVQLDMAKTLGLVPSLKNTGDLFKAIGKDVPQLQGKNVQAVYKYKPAEASPKREKGLIGGNPNDLKKSMEKAFDSVTLDKVDVNTALRTAQEEMAKSIETKKANVKTK
ncbi:extracellular solute-binding protein [Paenibacillus filicis]|uniref:Extracellular solute-binding protein n=1 Tax=Paenibacillus gyeongsangnamensis TaxID=3388067 RepID=A0ABT4Q9G9_9BACL|nr:extracellular solute-binding protein [Paenibacillus filicis]MCZ8513529.1 extracellular solute-binding protein [Paenibacillus filicis]